MHVEVAVLNLMRSTLFRNIRNENKDTFAD